MKKLLIISLLCISTSAYTQSVVGTWKRISSVLEYTNGKTNDLDKVMEKSYPCSKEIRYVFEKSGKHFMVLSKGCEHIPNNQADWKMVGNQFSITQKVGKEMMSSNYDISFSGNTMTMSHTYSKEEQASNAKKIILKYEKQ
jgi:hypothetical protein